MAVLLFIFLSSFISRTWSDQRVYYVAADEELWHYAPSGRNLITVDQNNLTHDQGDQHDGYIYKKILYKQYSDNQFTTQINSPSHHGYLGPVLDVEVGDELVVIFKNNASVDLTIHPHGVIYDKANEGSAYDAYSGVSSGDTHRYTWNITEESGPPMGTGCVSHLYHSDVDYIRDVNAGLVGFIRVCAKKKDINPLATEDLFLFFGINDENENPVSGANASVNKGNKMHSINGYVYGNLLNLTICLGASTRVHVGSLSESSDVHCIRLSGHSFTVREKRRDVLPLYSGVSVTAEIIGAEPGTWLLTSTSKKHIAAGMQALVTVRDCGLPRPTVDAAGKMRSHFIAAEETDWLGTKRQMFVEYRDRKFKEKYTRDQSTSYLGAVGPLIRAEVGDVLKIVFYNKLNTSLVIIPSGLRTSKEYEGLFYNDGRSNNRRVVTAPGEKRTYYWFVPSHLGPGNKDEPCIQKFYSTANIHERLDLVGPIVVCRENSLNSLKQQNLEDFFIFLNEDTKYAIGINGFIGNNVPKLHTCSGRRYRLHLVSFTKEVHTLISHLEPFSIENVTSSTIGLTPFCPVSVTLQTSREGVHYIKSFPDESAMIRVQTTNCDGHSTNETYRDTGETTYIKIIKGPWLYNRNTDLWKSQQSGTAADKMAPRYYRLLFKAHDPNFKRPLANSRYLGNIGQIFYAIVGDSFNIVFRQDLGMNYSISAPGFDTEHHDRMTNITWKISQNFGPGPSDPECISKAYFSSVNTEEDIVSGLIGPIIICNASVDFKQHTIFFVGEIDETKNWFFNETIEKINRGTVNSGNMEFLQNNQINMVNGFSDGSIPDISLGPGAQYIHFFNVGTNFESIHLSGLPVVSTNNYYVNNDVIGLHPGTSITVKLANTITGRWRISSLGTDRHWNKLEAIIKVPSTSSGAS